MSKEDWPISISSIKKNSWKVIRQVIAQKAYVFYPVFLLYTITIIGLAKFIQIIF